MEVRIKPYYKHIIGRERVIYASDINDVLDNIYPRGHSFDARQIMEMQKNLRDRDFLVIGDYQVERL